MPWFSAENVFAAADREMEALNPAPWLMRREGPVRSPNEGRVTGRSNLSDADRAGRYEILVAETERELADAAPGDAARLEKRLKVFRGKRDVLRNGRR